MSIYVDIRKKFSGFTLDVQLEAENEILGLLGASGCGKSMTLQCISGIEKPDSGVIIVNGRTFFDAEKKINLPIRQRNIGYSFQHFSLFPHMTVEGNLAFAAPEHTKEDRTRAVAEKAAIFGLTDYLTRYPGQLSGGQKQRVALARMLIRSPEILMLDEPFSALDTHVRLTLENELMQILGEFAHTALYVSHDMDEVYRICPQIAVLDDGKVVDQGKREHLLLEPKTLAVARMTGCKNISAARKTGEYRLFAKDWGIEIQSAKPVPDDLHYVGIRAHRIREVRSEEADGMPNIFPVQVEFESESRFETTVVCRLSGEGIPIRGQPEGIPTGARILWLYDKLYNRKTYPIGHAFLLHIPPESLHLICR